jgi:hypothetical protein
MIRIVTILLTTFLANICQAFSHQPEFDHCIVLAEQSQHSIVVINVRSHQIIWQWDAKNKDINPDFRKWFNAPSDAKVIDNGRYILTTASGGGVALIRIADKKVVFYAYAGGNTHSAEILPDGNIVCASSTGNYLSLFRTDTTNYPNGIYCEKITNKFGHNVVWDNKRKVLWSTANDYLITYRYNFNKDKPGLTRIDSIKIPGNQAHDLFPVHGEDALWLTTTDHVFKFTIPSGKFHEIELADDGNIKSIYSGPESYPVIVLRPKEKWWTDEIFDISHNSIFYEKGYRIYKARWFIHNAFSYGEPNMTIFGK